MAANIGRMVVLVGANHGFQLGAPHCPPERAPQFSSALRRLCRSHRIVAIGEEMSADALAVWSVKQTTCQITADSLSLAYKLCDPGEEERRRLGLDLDSDSLPEPERSRQWDIRERFWLRRLGELGRWPALFICGPNHVERFARLLEAEGIAVVVIKKRWRLSAERGSG